MLFIRYKLFCLYYTVALKEPAQRCSSWVVSQCNFMFHVLVWNWFLEVFISVVIYKSLNTSHFLFTVFLHSSCYFLSLCDSKATDHNLCAKYVLTSHVRLLGNSTSISQLAQQQYQWSHLLYIISLTCRCVGLSSLCSAVCSGRHNSWSPQDCKSENLKQKHASMCVIHSWYLGLKSIVTIYTRHLKLSLCLENKTKAGDAQNGTTTCININHHCFTSHPWTVTMLQWESYN